MKILQINATYLIGNIGRHVKATEEAILRNDDESFVVYGTGDIKDDHHYPIENRLSQKISILQTRLFGKHGFYNRRETKKAIEWIKNVDPDIIQLRNIHGHYINIQMLFEYIKDYKKEVFWTFHDCWPMTGHCAFFDSAKCDRWKTGCYDCPCLHDYPKTIRDQSTWNWNKKKELFTSIEKMHIIVPSNWLANIVKQSFFKSFDISVIPNGIRLDSFTPNGDAFKRKNNILDKTLVMGIAKGWSKRKGLEDIKAVANLLDDSFVFVIVGASKEQMRGFPQNTIRVERTNNVKELSEIYSSADILLNPTYEDNFPTVNIEALACGTPVITYNTGGSPESLTEKTGFVLNKGDIEGIVKILQSKKYPDLADCVSRSQDFKSDDRFDDYIKLYHDVKGDNNETISS